MAALLLLVIAVLCTNQAATNRYDDIIADIYGISDDGESMGSARDMYPRGGVSNRRSQYYGDLLGATQTRDQEYEPHGVPSLYGYKYISGGAGEGKQHLMPSGSVDNKEEVKTDKVLPAYCNPPNPCPIGYTDDDNCVEKFENTADYNRKYNNKQECSCDAEHMFKCPDDKKTISAKVHGGDDDESMMNLGDVINQLVDLEGSSNAEYILDLADKGNDHATISKKSMFRRKRAIEYPEENPFFSGLKLDTVAKKSPGMNKHSHSSVYV